MRLTLRTLLAYLDDTLEPAQAKIIGQKVAESESAQELVERIKQVTRRRRLTTPPTSGPSGIDPNTIADYLDNTVTPEQANEVEEICLSSDVHLAEVAACHQILTLVLGEPATVPLQASQRMYGVVKGPEAIPFRKPVGAARVDKDHHVEGREVDETLRMGLPPIGRKDSWANRLILIGGGVVAAGLLVFAIFQVLQLPGDKEKDPNRQQFAKGPEKDSSGKNQTDGAGAKDSGKTDGDGKKIDDKKNDDKKNPEPDKDKKDKVDPEPGPVDPPSTGDIPFGDPNPRQAPIARLATFENAEPSVLLQTGPDGNEWKQILPKKKDAEVYSARPLLALPGIRGQVDFDKGLRLVLWGTTPDQILVNGLFESLVELYNHDTLDLDMTLLRGRVVLTSTREKPILVRLRFENPAQVKPQEFVDITLQSKDSSILVDRLCNFPPFPDNEPFYKDPKNTNLAGPVAIMAFNVLSGTVFLKHGDVTQTLNPPPDTFQQVWLNRQGMSKPIRHTELPPHLALDPPLPKNVDARLRKDILRARKLLTDQLATNKAPGVVFAEMLKTLETLKPEDAAGRLLVLRCLAAVDDVNNLVEAVDNRDPNLSDLRHKARDALRDWIGTSRDHDYKLYSLLQERYKKRKEAEIIMEMLHGFSLAETKRPERYELLIEHLTSSNQFIRELAIWHLQALVPAGRNIGYNSAADSDSRSASAAAWRALVPPGQLPPAPKK